jgi:tyrosine-protein kinase Etk/Wzc
MNEEKHIIELHLFDHLMLVVRRRGLIVRNVGLTLLAVLLLSFVLPQRYTALTTLLPPAEQEKWSMSSVISEMSIPGLNLGSQASSADLLMEMLNSRTVNERVLQNPFKYKKDTLQLWQILDFETVEKALLRMPERAHFVISKKAVITISVEMPTPQLAADVANVYVEILDHVNQEKAVSRARNSRIYIETQLSRTSTDLNNAMQRLADYQQSHQAVSLEEQTKAAIERAGELKGQIIAKQVQLGVMQQSMKEANPLVERAERELAQLQRRYNEVQFGNGTAAKDYVMPFALVPGIGIQLAELLREVKIQETVWALLNQQYYQAKIEEARDIPTVQVLDRAVPPSFRSAPKRKMLLLIFGALSLILSILWVLLQNYWQNMDESSKIKARRLTDELRKDADRVRRFLHLPTR